MVDKVSLVNQPEVRFDSLASSSRDLQTANEFNEFYRRAKGIQEFGNSRFEAIDADKNGYLTIPEIQTAKENATEPNEKANLEFLEKNFTSLALVARTDESWLGIGRADLDRLKNVMQPGGPKHYMQFEKIYASGLAGAGGGFTAAMMAALAYGEPRIIFPAAGVAFVAGTIGGWYLADKLATNNLELERDQLRTMLRSVEIR